MATCWQIDSSHHIISLCTHTYTHEAQSLHTRPPSISFRQVLPPPRRPSEEMIRRLDDTGQRELGSTDSSRYSDSFQAKVWSSQSRRVVTNWTLKPIPKNAEREAKRRRESHVSGGCVQITAYRGNYKLMEYPDLAFFIRKCPFWYLAFSAQYNFIYNVSVANDIISM